MPLVLLRAGHASGTMDIAIGDLAGAAAAMVLLGIEHA